MNQIRSFSQNILKSILFDWGFFWSWSFEFKITNHISIDLWIDWLIGTVKIKLKSFFFWGFLLNFSFSISTFNLFFNLFLCLVYIYICSFRLVLSFLYVFEHVRMLDLSFYSLLCFTVLLKYLSWFSCTHNPFCICMLDKVVFHFVFYSLFNEIAGSSKKNKNKKELYGLALNLFTFG